MFEKRHRITLLFNANKAYDRQVVEGVGEYLQADRVNQMIDDPNTVFVDMRNHYEYEVGHFENAIEVPSDTFRDQLPMAVEMLQDPPAAVT